MSSVRRRQGGPECKHTSRLSHIACFCTQRMVGIRAADVDHKRGSSQGNYGNGKLGTTTEI